MHCTQGTIGVREGKQSLSTLDELKYTVTLISWRVMLLSTSTTAWLSEGLSFFCYKGYSFHRMECKRL